MDDDVAFRIQWEGLELETTCPIHIWPDILGALGNEMLRLNAALSVIVAESQPVAHAEEPT